MDRTAALQLDQELALYEPSHVPALLRVPAQQFLALDGNGSLVGLEFQAAARVLGIVSGEIVQLCRRGLGLAVPPGPLEALWHSPDGDGFDQDDRSRWTWTVMVRCPEVLAPELVEELLLRLATETEQVGFERVRILKRSAERVAQRVHVGPDRTQRRALADLHAFIARQGLCCHGRQHEIYLTDPTGTELERLVTIIRQPVRARVPNPDPVRGRT